MKIANKYLDCLKINEVSYFVKPYIIWMSLPHRRSYKPSSQEMEMEKLYFWWVLIYPIFYK